MKGYKVFNSDWTCRHFQYEIGKSYEMEDAPIICERGFHFCTELKDCFRYYDLDPKNKIAEVDAYGDIDRRDNDTKCCTNKIRIIREIAFEEALNILGYKKTTDDYFDVKEVTLLSSEEYIKYKENIPNIYRYWWLRSPGLTSNLAASVLSDGSVYRSGSSVGSDSDSVRPALIINPKSSNLQIGEKVIFKENPWTIISNNIMICDRSVGETCFRRNYLCADANVYDNSDIKIWLANWASNNGIINGGKIW